MLLFSKNISSENFRKFYRAFSEIFCKIEKIGYVENMLQPRTFKNVSI